ncbi:MAG: AAA family ATPase [Nitrospira sp.]|nr:AAA family ATPase [Nitrospira sp.]
MFGDTTWRPYASAPVRSKPHRTYDPSRPTRDSVGDYIPMYLANVHFQNKQQWKALKVSLEKFGQSAGLFDEISVKPLGQKESGPFQVQVRKFGSKSMGLHRNLIDVGYGVSQVLPVVTELLRQDVPPMFLLQQPEVHLHPSAQAALGSLFCQTANSECQLVVETHSDHLLDRVRMDVRDGKTKLKPDDVSILFFERGDLDVRIHSLRLDKEGNVLNAPQSYRKFFMDETERSLGLF